MNIKLTDEQMKQKDRYKKFLLAMIDKGITQKEIAEKIGISEPMVSYIIWGIRKSKRKEKQICAILNIKEEDIAS